MDGAKLFVYAGWEFSFLPCPFSGRLPEITVDEPKEWDGRVWVWLRVEGCYVPIHIGRCGLMRYQKIGTWEVVEYRTQEEAAIAALEDLRRAWNTRSN